MRHNIGQGSDAEVGRPSEGDGAMKANRARGARISLVLSIVVAIAALAASAAPARVAAASSHDGHFMTLDHPGAGAGSGQGTYRRISTTGETSSATGSTAATTTSASSSTTDTSRQSTIPRRGRRRFRGPIPSASRRTASWSGTTSTAAMPTTDSCFAMAASPPSTTRAPGPPPGRAPFLRAAMNRSDRRPNGRRHRPSPRVHDAGREVSQASMTPMRVRASHRMGEPTSHSE